MNVALVRLALLALTVVLASACSTSPAEDIAEGSDINGDALVNGGVAPVGTFRSTLNLDSLGCTGALVGPKRILTAAHCVTRYEGAAPRYLLDGLEGETMGVTSTQVRGLADFRRTAFVTVVRVHVAPEYLAQKFAKTLSLPSDAVSDLAVLEIDWGVSGQYVMPNVPVATVRAAPVTQAERLKIGGYGCVLAADCGDENINDGMNKALRMGNAIARSIATDTAAHTQLNAANSWEKLIRVYKAAADYPALKARIDRAEFFQLSPNAADTRIGHGDSGGPVYDAQSRVVGVNSSGDDTYSAFARVSGASATWLKSLGCKVE